MAIITTLCSQTGKQVSTGSEMDAAAFNALPYSRHFVFDCWLCGDKHEWSRRWATLVDETAISAISAIGAKKSKASVICSNIRA